VERRAIDVGIRRIGRSLSRVVTGDGSASSSIPGTVARRRENIPFTVRFAVSGSANENVSDAVPLVAARDPYGRGGRAATEDSAG